VCTTGGASPTKVGGGVWLNSGGRQPKFASPHSRLEIIMGKYLLGWVLGVPAIVLVVAYFLFH
jgi:hypothetical protein